LRNMKNRSCKTPIAHINISDLKMYANIIKKNTDTTHTQALHELANIEGYKRWEVLVNKHKKHREKTEYFYNSCIVAYPRSNENIQLDLYKDQYIIYDVWAYSLIGFDIEYTNNDNLQYYIFDSNVQGMNDRELFESIHDRVGVTPSFVWVYGELVLSPESETRIAA